MIPNVGTHLPSAWSVAKVSEIAEVNPRLDVRAHADSSTVSFVPMTAVEAETGAIDLSRTRQLSEVRKGYRSFQAGDVLFAKITPCMENGKMAVVPELEYGVGFGSTEFHVLRPHREISSDYVYRFVSAAQFRRDAEHHMTGVVGQRRVPTSYLREQPIPLPPANEQHRIATKIDELLSDLDIGIARLKKARAQLTTYRKAVLKHAFEGYLTAQWREDNKDILETHEKLTLHIKNSRAAHSDRQLADWRLSLEDWKKRGGAGKKPIRPRVPKSTSTLGEDVIGSPREIPSGWLWLTAASVGVVQLGRQRSPKNRPKDYATKYIRAANITESGLDLSDVLDMEFRPHELTSYRLEEDDLLLSEASGSAAQVGKPAIWKGQIPNCCFQNTVIRHQLYCREFAPYILWLYRFYYLSGRFAQVAGGVGINHLGASKFAQIMIPICSFSEQQEVARRLTEIFVTIEQQEREVEAALKRAGVLRQAILNKAFSGRLVPHYRSEEPASILLDKIRAEREQVTTCTTHRKRMMVTA